MPWELERSLSSPDSFAGLCGSSCGCPQAARTITGSPLMVIWFGQQGPESPRSSAPSSRGGGTARGHHDTPGTTPALQRQAERKEPTEESESWSRGAALQKSAITKCCSERRTKALLGTAAGSRACFVTGLHSPRKSNANTCPEPRTPLGKDELTESEGPELSSEILSHLLGVLTGIRCTCPLKQPSEPQL